LEPAALPSDAAVSDAEAFKMSKFRRGCLHLIHMTRSRFKQLDGSVEVAAVLRLKDRTYRTVGGIPDFTTQVVLPSQAHHKSPKSDPLDTPLDSNSECWHLNPF
jgi:hypothetical protein